VRFVRYDAGGFGYLHPAAFFRWLEHDAHPGVQDAGDPAQGSKRVAFIARGLKAADLLLGGFEKFGEVLLGKPGLLAQRGDLQCHIPRLARVLKAGGKRRVLQLSFEIAVANWFFSLFCSLPPVTHPFPCSVELASRDRLPFVTDAVNRYDPAILHEKPSIRGY
jgi:hypothetical protein